MANMTPMRELYVYRPRWNKDRAYRYIGGLTIVRYPYLILIEPLNLSPKCLDLN